MPYRVICFKEGPQFDYPDGFFPRTVKTKKQADALIARMRRLGGEGRIATPNSNYATTHANRRLAFATTVPFLQEMHDGEEQ